MAEARGEIKEEEMTAKLQRKSATLTLSESISSLWAACWLSRRFVSWEQIWAKDHDFNIIKQNISRRNVAILETLCTCL